MSISKNTNKKKILLTAASTIVKEEGVLKLTLEAVAQKAGVSKGGLLYHYPNKEALIKGMVEDWTNNYFESIETLASSTNIGPGKWGMAYVKSTYSDIDKNSQLSSALMAAMMINPELLDDYRQKYNSFITKLIDDGIDPVKITIARLSIDGLWFSEIFNLARLNSDLKTQVFNELIKLIQEDE